MITTHISKTFNYCTCEVENEVHVYNAVTGAGIPFTCAMVPHLRYALNGLLAGPAIFLPLADSCEDDSYASIGLNIALITVTVINMLASFCFWSKANKQDKSTNLPTVDELLPLRSNQIDKESIEKLKYVKTCEICSFLFYTVILATSVTVLAVKC